MIPSRLVNPMVDRMPNRARCDEGPRIEFPVSEPNPATPKLAATPEAVPPLEPAGTLSTESNGGLVKFGAGGTIDGDAFCGVGGDPDVVITGVALTGEKYALTESPFLPVIVPPSLPDKAADLLVSDPGRTVTPADSGKYIDLNLDNMQYLTVDGGDVVLEFTGDIDMGNNAEIIVNPGASLILYTHGNDNCEVMCKYLTVKTFRLQRLKNEKNIDSVYIFVYTFVMFGRMHVDMSR